MTPNVKTISLFVSACTSVVVKNNRVKNAVLLVECGEVVATGRGRTDVCWANMESGVLC